MKINLPEGPHEALEAGEFGEMLNMLAHAAQSNEQVATVYFGEQRGKAISDVAPFVAYLNASRAAWGLIAVADICGHEFDPVAFGRRCEAIAREQAARYRLVVAEVKGSA